MYTRIAQRVYNLSLIHKGKLVFEYNFFLKFFCLTALY